MGDEIEDGLLLSLADTDLGHRVGVLYVIGAHRFQERELLDRAFPRLEHLVLFEPVPELRREIEAATAGDRRVRVLPYAIADRCGPAEFFITDNDAASSSLLPMKRHRDLFPHVHHISTLVVEVRTLPAAAAEHSLPPPDALFIDVQGAEYRVLSAMGEQIRGRLQLVYTEASTEEVYEGARDLDELAALLGPELRLHSFAPLSAEVPTHGNALFVRSSFS